MESHLIYELIGYIASLLVAISLMMSAIVKLRIVNMIGAFIFAVYGILIGSIPVAAMNGFIVLINIYFLIKIVTDKEYFHLLETESSDSYLSAFLSYYSESIQKFQPDFSIDREYNFALFILSEMVPAGLLLGELKNDKTLIIHLDFVIPDYRDFKIGKFLFSQNREYFRKHGVKTIVTAAGNSDHNHYLEKVGFSKTDNSGYYELNIA